jgi:twitching motility two-component system response regulator PilG
MASYRPFQKLHPLTLLAQLSSRQADGCLQVSNGSTSWLIYLEKGKLIYATNSNNPFERLDRHLRRLSAQIPSLVSAVRVQVRLLFESQSENTSALPTDYQAICWLVEQQHLQSNQVNLLIEALAVEVIESFLAVQDGNHELIAPEQLGMFPKFCQLDLRFLVEQCQARQRQTTRTPERTIEQALVANQMSTQNGSGTKSNESAVATETAVEQGSEEGNLRPQYPSSTSLSSNGKTHYTIACIDDSPTVLQAIRSFLDDRSFSVLMIDNPVKALMQIVRSKPDLILLDVTMPNLDGYELCSLLRKHPHFRYTPVIMVTGNTGFIDRARAKLVGASGYLTKPFTQSDLVKMVFKHLT